MTCEVAAAGEKRPGCLPLCDTPDAAAAWAPHQTPRRIAVIDAVRQQGACSVKQARRAGERVCRRHMRSRQRDTYESATRRQCNALAHASADGSGVSLSLITMLTRGSSRGQGRRTGTECTPFSAVAVLLQQQHPACSSDTGLHVYLYSVLQFEHRGRHRDESDPRSQVASAGPRCVLVPPPPPPDTWRRVCVIRGDWWVQAATSKRRNQEVQGRKKPSRQVAHARERRWQTDDKEKVLVKHLTCLTAAGNERAAAAAAAEGRVCARARRPRVRFFFEGITSWWWLGGGGQCSHDGPCFSGRVIFVAPARNVQTIFLGCSCSEVSKKNTPNTKYGSSE